MITEKPPAVKELERKFTERDMWFETTTNANNQEALGCWDAAHKRVRLGHQGIQIYAELKSGLYSYLKDGKAREVLVHCRGNHEVDEEKIKGVVRADVQRTKDDDKFGLVNPFLGFDEPDILQIFDTSILNQKIIPYTMMTNASDRRWGIEFKPLQLIDNLPNKMVADVVLDSTKFDVPRHRIGILTGNSAESGILLWEMINTRIRETLGDNNFLGDISMPEVIVESLPEMGLSMELDLRKEEVRETVTKGVTNLCKQGATIVCIACNTTQYFSPECKEICDKHNAKYVRMSEVTSDYLKRNNVKEFDFLGIKFVSDFENWSDFKELKKEFSLNLPKEEDISKISQIAFEVKQGGSSGEGMKTLQELRKLIDAATNTQTVVFALTELSVLYKSQEKYFTKNSTKAYRDTLTILAEYVGDLCTKDYMAMIHREDKAGNTEAQTIPSEARLDVVPKT